MEKIIINAENDMQGMFFCWTQVSRRMEKTMTEGERELLDYLNDHIVHRTVEEECFRSVTNEIRNRAKVLPDKGERLQFCCEAPNDVCSGYIRITRRDDPKAVINIPIIDWRGTKEPILKG